MRGPRPRRPSVAFAASVWALAAAATLTGAVAADSQPDSVSTADSADALVFYHLQRGDTLIGLAKRLLVDPKLWRSLGALNQVRRERALQPGSQLRIPIAWLRWSAQSTAVLAVGGNASADGKPVAPGQSLSEGTNISTGEDGSIALQLPDGSQVTLPKSTDATLGHTRAAVGTDAPDIQVQLARGHVDVQAHKHHDVGRFEIRTPTAITAVRGTQFRSHFDASDASATDETLEGVIEVSANAASLPVPSGFGTRTDPGAAPRPPVKLLDPPDLSGVPELNLHSTLSVSFAPVPQAHAYRLQLARNEQFLSIERDDIFPEPTARFEQLPDGIYWLRVRAIDGLGLEGLDAVRRLQQQVLPEPPVPAPTPPGIETTPGGVHVSWSQTAPRYHVELARDDTFAAPVADYPTVDEPQLDLKDLAPGHYLWRVAAIDAHGRASTWSDASAFTLRPPAPSFDSVELSRKHTVQLRWQARPEYAAVVQVARDPAFSKVVIEQRAAGSETVLPKLSVGTYYLRMRWVDTNGYEGPFGAVRVVRVPLSPWLLLIVPAAAITAALL